MEMIKVKINGGNKMGSDIKKLFWTGVAVVCVILFASSVITPTKNQIRGIEPKIEAVDYTSQ